MQHMRPFKMIHPGKLLDSECIAREIQPPDDWLPFIYGGDLTIELANEFERELMISAEFWMRLYTNYKEWLDEENKAN